MRWVRLPNFKKDERNYPYRGITFRRKGEVIYFYCGQLLHDSLDYQGMMQMIGDDRTRYRDNNFEDRLSQIESHWQHFRERPSRKNVYQLIFEHPQQVIIFEMNLLGRDIIDFENRSLNAKIYKEFLRKLNAIH